MPYRPDIPDEGLIDAIEENGAEFLLAMGRAAGAEEHCTSSVHWIIGGSPIDYHNCVVRADLGPADADTTIAASIARFEAHGVPGTWHVGPSMWPLHLGDRLLRHGFVESGADIDMAIELDQLPASLPGPETLVIERVADELSLAAWTSVLARSFGEGEPGSAWVGEIYRRIGLSDDVPWRHFLGRLDGEPVATASLFVGAGAAGIYVVSTLPAARHRGIGAAITLAALRAGRELGQRLGVLGSSSDGYPVYRRLGLRDPCRIRLFAWH